MRKARVGKELGARLASNRVVLVTASMQACRKLTFIKVAAPVLASLAPSSSPPRIALCGEGVSLLWARGEIETALRLEELSSEVVKMYGVEILCR